MMDAMVTGHGPIVAHGLTPEELSTPQWLSTLAEDVDATDLFGAVLGGLMEAENIETLMSEDELTDFLMTAVFGAMSGGDVETLLAASGQYEVNLTAGEMVAIGNLGLIGDESNNLLLSVIRFTSSGGTESIMGEGALDEANWSIVDGATYPNQYDFPVQLDTTGANSVPVNMVLGNAGIWNDSEWPVWADAHDNCGLESLSLSMEDVDCEDVGTNEVEVSITAVSYTHLTLPTICSV